jgi:hypothetical protein
MKQLSQAKWIPGIDVGDGKASWKSEWVEVAPGRKVLVSDSQRKVESVRYANAPGTRPDETWEQERYRKLYGEKMIVCEDLKDKRARKTWPGYKVLPDGREGPLPFRNNAERKAYCDAFGFRCSGEWR